MGFQPAPYLDLTAEDGDRGTGLQSFASDDGERVRQMLGQVGSNAARISRSLVEQGKQLVVATGRIVEPGAQPAGDSNGQAPQAAVFQYLDAQRLPRGPVTLDELAALAMQGRVQDDTLCQRVGETAWVTYGQLVPRTHAQN